MIEKTPIEVLQKKRKKYLYESAQLFMPDLPPFIRGDMAYLYTQDNVPYLDMLSGFSVSSMGHANQEVNQFIKAQLDKYAHSTQIFLNEPILTLSDLLYAQLPEPLEKFMYLNSGSEANDFAIMLAKNFTGKSGVLHLQYSLHGRTQHTLEVTGMKMWHPYDLSHDAVFEIPTYFKNEEASLQAVENILTENKEISCMIIEMVQVNGGVLTTESTYFKALLALLHAHGVLLIVDEAQTCMGRTGTFCAFQQYGIEPDILVMSKGIGNGIGLSTCITRKDIADAYKTPSVSTHGGNLIACASGIGVMTYFKTHNIQNHISEISSLLDGVLEPLKKSPRVKDIRGVGLIRGIEIEPEKFPETIKGIFDEKIIVGVCGLERNVILIEPPLIVNEKDITDFSRVLQGVLGV